MIPGRTRLSPVLLHTDRTCRLDGRGGTRNVGQRDDGKSETSRNTADVDARLTKLEPSKAIFGALDTVKKYATRNSAQPATAVTAAPIVTAPTGSVTAPLPPSPPLTQLLSPTPTGPPTLSPVTQSRKAATVPAVPATTPPPPLPLPPTQPTRPPSISAT